MSERASPTSTSTGSPAGSRRAELGKLNFPVPARHALPGIKKYAHVERAGRRDLAAYVEASRGCKHHCRHCPIPPVYDGRFFVVPVDTVLADVRQQVEAGASHVTFGDPDFLNGPRHGLAVARALHAELPRVTFDFTAKVEHLLRERLHLGELAALGCAFIVTAAESLDDRVLGYLDKGHTARDLVAALGAAREAGIALRPTWVAFTPWTTLEGYRQWLDFLADEALVDHVDPVQYGIRLLIHPARCCSTAQMRPHLGELVPGGFHYRWTHPDPRVERLAEEVAGVVAAGAERNEDAALTFDRVRGLAAAAAGAPAPEPLGLPANRTQAAAAHRAVVLLSGADPGPVGPVLGRRRIRRYTTGLRGDVMSDDLKTKVQELIDSMINPAVAGHGGFVELVDVQDNRVYLQMGGGCQGCGAADITLKSGIERLIKEELPEVAEVLDTTDHASGSNPYYQAGKA